MERGSKRGGGAGGREGRKGGVSNSTWGGQSTNVTIAPGATHAKASPIRLLDGRNEDLTELSLHLDTNLPDSLLLNLKHVYKDIPTYFHCLEASKHVKMATSVQWCPQLVLFTCNVHLS